MKFLLDQNIERRLALFQKQLGHDVKIVSVDYPAGLLDNKVLETAYYKERRILITNDRSDFGELIFRFHKPHCGVILFRHLRSGDIFTKQKRFSYVLENYANQLHHFIVVTLDRVKVREMGEHKKAA
jgi:predicted nuclease of predicted toxin-antitoxin system